MVISLLLNPELVVYLLLSRREDQGGVFESEEGPVEESKELVLAALVELLRLQVLLFRVLHCQFNPHGLAEPLHLFDEVGSDGLSDFNAYFYEFVYVLENS